MVVSDSVGCKSSATQFVEITGINGLLDERISIYPNPSKGIFTLDIPGIALEGFIEIFNGVGQVIYSTEGSTHEKEFKQDIDLTNQSSGVYMLRVNMEDKMFYKKILITK